MLWKVNQAITVSSVCSMRVKLKPVFTTPWTQQTEPTRRFHRRVWPLNAGDGACGILGATGWVTASRINFVHGGNPNMS